ncbi:transglutaminaseTgpA domain-containing protein [Streptomyces sp. NPDC059680]|uniref:transglutaminase family protein n=1 Tax=Streptomyces sp. NPDC059680 TaxID=3346904 RepID=UPI00368839BA
MNESSYRQLPWLVVAIAASGFVFDTAFRYEDLAAPVLVGVILPAMAVAALRRVRPSWGPEADLPFLAVLGFAVCILLLFRDVLVAHGLFRAAREAVSAESAVWSRLGVSLPASGDADALVAPFTLTWAVTVSAVELRLRARAEAVALLPPTGAVIVAVVMCAPRTAGAIVPGVCFTLAAAADLVGRESGRLSGGVRRWWGAAALVTSCVVLATAIATGSPWLTDRVPYDVVRSSGKIPQSALGPLAQAAAWASRPHETLFRAMGPTSARWVLADLDRYDGVEWQPSGRFVSTASLAYLSTTRHVASDTSSTDVHIEGMTGPYLPLPRNAVAVEGLPVTVSRHDGTVLAQRRIRRGSGYRATVLRKPSGTSYLDDILAPDRSDPTSLDLPQNAPSDLAEFVSQSTSVLPASATPYQQAGALARRLTSHYAYRPAEAADQTLGGTARLLATRQGSAAAFATAFVLGARELGLPARVAVGFSAGTRARDGSRTVTGADVDVWGEVRFAGVGWLEFNILPRPTAGPEAALPLPTLQPPSSTPTATPTSTSSPIRPPSASAEPSPPPPTPSGASGGVGRESIPWSILLTCMGLVASAVAVWTWLVAPRLRRYWAERRSTPAARVEGAWEVTTARLARQRLLSRKAPRTPDYIADALHPEARETLAPQLTALGALATQARFGEPDAEEVRHHPHWPQMTDADAEGAWQLEAEIANRSRKLVRHARARALRRPLNWAPTARSHVPSRPRGGDHE